MRIAEVKQRRGAQHGGIAYVIRMQAAVAREQIQVAGHQLQADRFQPAAPHRKGDQLLTDSVMQHGLFNDVAQRVESDMPRIGKDDQVAAVFAFSRNVQR